MPRSRRGFQLQQFLPGNVVPSSASKPTGVVPKSPLSMTGGPEFAASAAATTPFQQAMAQNKQTQIQGISPGYQPPPTTTGSKFGDLQKALGGINLGTNLMTQQKTLGSSLLGADASGTDWTKLFGYQGVGKDLIAAALKQYGITKPTGGLGATNSFSQDWMKSMGLV